MRRYWSSKLSGLFGAIEMTVGRERRRSMQLERTLQLAKFPLPLPFLSFLPFRFFRIAFTVRIISRHSQTPKRDTASRRETPNPPQCLDFWRGDGWAQSRSGCMSGLSGRCYRNWLRRRTKFRSKHARVPSKVHRGRRVLASLLNVSGSFLWPRRRRSWRGYPTFSLNLLELLGCGRGAGRSGHWGCVH